MSKHGISVSSANKDYGRSVAVGQYIAYWMSGDRQRSMWMGHGDTEAETIAEAEAEMERNGLELLDGSVAADLVVADGHDEV